MREKNQKDSRKRLNALILLVAFTAVLLIVSTYAWFSTQRNVVLSGLKGEVRVAEGLQVSLDGSHFVNTINFDDFDQTTNPDGWVVKNTATTVYLDDGKTFQAPADGVTNVVPSDYKPVSTTGSTDEGIGKNGLQMYGGEYTKSEGLKTIALKDEAKASGFFAFDLFLMNTSKADTPDKLQLDATSTIVAGDATKGTQNTVRVGFALYNNTGAEVGTDKTLSGAEIIAGTSTDKTIRDVAIWEPLANKHVATIVENTLIKFSATDKGKYTLGAAVGAYNKIVDNQVLPTYALTTASATAGSIADVYDWATPATGLTLQNTTQTTDEFGTEGHEDSIDLNSVKLGDAGAVTPITMVANQYQKLRVYVWIEGQDPDCINYASLGKSLTLDLGLSKPGTTQDGV